jgi:hypothetical protein
MCIYIVGCSGCGYVYGGIGTMYFDYLGRSGFAVGCLPAPLRSGPTKKPAGLPSSPPNAKATAKAMTWTWGSNAKYAPQTAGERFGDVLLM